MSARARRGLDAFLSRKSKPMAERVSRLELDDAFIELRVRRHPTARRMTLRIAPDGSQARVSIPRWAAFREGEAFAHDRREWIGGQLARIPQLQPVENGATLPFRGHVFTIAWDRELPRSPFLDANTIRLGGPAETIAPRLRRWLEGEALRLFEIDTAHFCARAGMPLPQVRLSRARRRWGSCAQDGTIRLNWRLIMAPDNVRRSVVAHEVAHFAHFDHSPAFRAALARTFDGDLAHADAWLKRDGRTLYARFD